MDVVLHAVVRLIAVTSQEKVMSDNTGTEDGKTVDAERTKRATVAGWTAGITALIALGALSSQPVWPVAIGVVAVAAMVAVACYFILKGQ